MTRIERLEEALEVALKYLGAYPGSFGEPLRDIGVILNPPPEYEEVEESAGWVNVYPSINGYVARHSCPTKEEADAQAFTDRIDCQEIKVKVRREKVRPVERSVTVAVTLRGDGVITAPCPTPIQPFMQHPDFHGCKGSLTFTTTDPPK
jgi:hypothetical protein